MNKLEHAQYLLTLQGLLRAQDAAGLPQSPVLQAEYKRHWGLYNKVRALPEPQEIEELEEPVEPAPAEEPVP